MPGPSQGGGVPLDTGQYLEQLGALGLERLQKEPELLRLEEVRHENELHAMATSGYQAFIGSVEAISFVRESARGMVRSLDGMQATLPELVSACDQFGTRATELAAERKTNRESLNCYTTLVEVLEIPQVMDTCVRNQHFDEAIELLAFARSMGRSLKDIRVVQQVVADVEASASAMVEQLLGLLRTPLQLHICLRVVAHLRRLKAFSPAELSRKFLECRDQWLESELRELQLETNVVTRLTKTADCLRVSMYEILNQFHAIFASDESVPGLRESLQMAHEWAVLKATAMLAELEQGLSRVADSILIASLLDQYMHCGHSLSRVGLDFRGLLVPIFESRMLEMVRVNMLVVPDEFNKLLGQMAPPSGPAPPQLHSTSSDPLAAPVELLSCSPVAALCNYMLTCFNDMRHCAARSLAGPIARLVVDALAGAAAHIMRGQHFSKAREVFRASLLPYIERCFNAVFNLEPRHSPFQLTGLQAKLAEVDQNASVPVPELKAAAAPPEAAVPLPPAAVAAQQLSRPPPTAPAPPARVGLSVPPPPPPTGAAVSRPPIGPPSF